VPGEPDAEHVEHLALEQFTAGQTPVAVGTGRRRPLAPSPSPGRGTAPSRGSRRHRNAPPRGRPVDGGHVRAEIEPGLRRVAQPGEHLDQPVDRDDDRPVADPGADRGGPGRSRSSACSHAGLTRSRAAADPGSWRWGGAFGSALAAGLRRRLRRRAVPVAAGASARRPAWRWFRRLTGHGVAARRSGTRSGTVRAPRRGHPGRSPVAVASAAAPSGSGTAGAGRSDPSCARRRRRLLAEASCASCAGVADCFTSPGAGRSGGSGWLAARSTVNLQQQPAVARPRRRGRIGVGVRIRPSPGARRHA